MDDIYVYLLIGLFAQLIDGAFGMAFGIITTSLLLFLYPDAITPALASAITHFSEIFTTGYATHVYKKNKMFNTKMYRTMLYPAIIGSIFGAVIISIFSKHFVCYIKPFIALYFIIVSITIAFRAFRLFEKRRRWISIRALSAFGSLMDSLGGGGWGALVTSALIVGGRDMRSTIGTSHAIKFIISLISSITFITFLGYKHLWIVLWVTLGSLVAVPLSIYLNNKLPKKWGLLAIALILFLISIEIFINHWIYLF